MIRPSAVLCLFLAASAAAFASTASAQAIRFDVPSPPAVDAKAIAVVDMANGDVLFEQNADVVIPPASLTKIMTMLLALDDVEAGRVALTDRIAITHEDATLPYRSSLMYLEEGMHVPFDDLLRGMAVVSGNDAALTVARVLSGSVSAFADRMNAKAAQLGMTSTRFVEPSGLSELNVSTARDLARLARAYMLRHPGALAAYHSRTSMEFPRADVMPDGAKPPAQKILLRNRNDLLFKYPGCDGLKTGYIDESGYNLIATAERAGSRFVVVTLGGSEGPPARDRAGASLLDWSFLVWRTVRPVVPDVPNLRVWGGAVERIRPVPASDVAFTLPVALASGVTARVELDHEAQAPLDAGTRLGRIVYTSGDHVVRRIDLIAADSVPLGNIFIRMRDAIARFFAHLFDRAKEE